MAVLCWIGFILVGLFVVVIPPAVIRLVVAVHHVAPIYVAILHCEPIVIYSTESGIYLILVHHVISISLAILHHSTVHPRVMFSLIFDIIVIYVHVMHCVGSKVLAALHIGTVVCRSPHVVMSIRMIYNVVYIILAILHHPLIVHHVWVEGLVLWHTIGEHLGCTTRNPHTVLVWIKP